MNGIRRSMGLLIGMTLMCGFAFLLFQTAAPEVQAADAAATRLGWLGGCYPPMRAVGRYFPGDAPCRPSEIVSLDVIQAALSAHEVLQPGETLGYTPEVRARALTCWGLIKARGQAVGWLCSDEAGVYRVDMNGQMASGRWLLLTDGTWTEAEGIAGS